MSSTCALWVSQPAEMRSTPVAAMAGAVAGVMRPEASVMARPATIATASRSGRAHVVEQHGVDADRQRLVELLEGVDLELDLHQMTDAGAGALDRRADAAGMATWLSLISTASSRPKR